MNELKSKYKVDTSDTGKLKRTFNGILFDSEMEMKYYRDVLCPKMESGEVADVELQKVYQLQPKYVYHGKTIREITYVADFYVTYSDGTFEVIEIKGMLDDGVCLNPAFTWNIEASSFNSIFSMTLCIKDF